MNRLSEQKTATRLDEFLVQQTEQVANPTLGLTNLPSYANVTRGSIANLTTTTSPNSEPLGGYVVQKPAHPQHPVAPQHSKAKPSRGKPRGGLENSVKRMIPKKANKKPARTADLVELVEPVDDSNEFLIDFS